MSGSQILALAIAVFVGLSIGGLIWREQWRMYVAGSMNLPQSIDDPTEADRSQWPTDEYANVQAAAEEFDAQPTLREETIPFLPGAPVPPPVRVHSQCLDAWADGKRPCGRCESILGVRA